MCDSEGTVPIWEIGISEAGEETWEHQHPRAESKEKARLKALQQTDFYDPHIYMVLGPFESSEGDS